MIFYDLPYGITIDLGKKEAYKTQTPDNEE